MPTGDEVPADETTTHDVTPRPDPPARARGSVVAAAMLGLGQVIEPEKTKVVIEQTNDDPFGDADIDLDFGGIPPRDDDVS